MRPKKSQRNSAYWMYGPHAVMAALKNDERTIHEAVAAPNMLPRLQSAGVAARFKELPLTEISRLLPKEAVHQGVAIRVDPLDPADLRVVLSGGWPLLVLDQVTDPHNVGAILRSAAAFDAGAIIVPRDHAPGESAVMAKSASGALDTVPMVIVGNLAAALKEIKQAGYWVAGMDGDARQSIAEAKLDRKTALVLGAEGKGLRRLTAENCDLLVKLPMSDRMESLNVSNAAAIALYELFRGG